MGNLTSVTETDGRTTRYTYDGMNRISKMEYPHGWVEDYQYDSVGHLLNVTDTDPSNNDMKQQKHA
ncbi:RHS repeat domain-containing protein, partial [Sedimentibacter saalensis]